MIYKDEYGYKQEIYLTPDNHPGSLLFTVGRSMKRFIQSRVETLIAKAIIQGSYTEGATLTVDYDGTGLVLR